MITDEIKLRTNVLKEDIINIRNIVASTGFFRNDEIDVAVDIVVETNEKGESAGYKFVFAEINNETVAYVCFGLIPCTLVSYDLYWIACHEKFRGKGLGKILLEKCEEIVKSLRGKAIYIETSSKEIYEPTRNFYIKNNYDLMHTYPDFYDIGDNKLVYVKSI
ncbi:MAG: GNAT family N-acetyltransferase [Bacteroidota bacterium]